MKTCIIHIYFGELPQWFSLFLQSCEYNNHLDFLLLTDNQNLCIDATNIKTEFISKGLFEKFAADNLGFQISIANSYKLCEFKPAYGIIFKDFLKDYDYWGYCDNDLLLGDIKSFFSSKEIELHDIISTYNNFMSGPFCIYRNIEKINNLFRLISNYQRVYQHTDWCATEENFIGVSGFSSFFRKLIGKIGFYFFNKIKKGISLSKKFNNYWMYKRKRMDTKAPKDISEVVWREQEEGNIKALFKPLLKSDREYKREGQSEWKVIWENGKLFKNTHENEIFAFHFVDSKVVPEFKASFKQTAKTITLTKIGQNQ